MTRNRVFSAPTAGAGAGWRTALYAIGAALVLELTEAAAAVSGTDRALRVPAALLAAGWVAAVALAAFGVWRRTRWGAWMGGILAAGTLVLVPLSMQGTVHAPAMELVDNPVLTAVAWLKLAAYAALLTGLAVARARGEGRITG